MAEVLDTKMNCFGLPRHANSIAFRVPRTLAERSFSYGYTQWTFTNAVESKIHGNKCDDILTRAPL